MAPAHGGKALLSMPGAQKILDSYKKNVKMLSFQVKEAVGRWY